MNLRVLLRGPGLLHTVAVGLGAGAVGATVLNLATYADMTARGRPASSAPAQLVERVTSSLGVEVGRGGRRDARLQGLGALLGIGTGIATGVGGSLLVRSHHPRTTTLAMTLGVSAMLASDLPLVLTGVTDPRQWGPSGWFADLMPHAAYGMATALVLG